MILVFGGTTEGRRAAEVLEQAGCPFYYSTKTGEQSLVLRHGIRIDGAMNQQALCLFCREKDIRVMVDASHPFAEELHRTIACVAHDSAIPVIRFDRIFPKRRKDIEWVERLEDIRWGSKPQHILSTLGVKSIGRLKPYESERLRFTYRILPRESSVSLAHQQGATDEQLCYYQRDEDERAFLERMHPDVLLLKESGLSGGFEQKVEAATALGIRVIAVCRPAYPVEHPVMVDGAYGLRRAVERLLPTFFPLRTGLTTGTCATAAVKAALLSLLGEEEAAVWVQLPDGESVLVDVETTGVGEAAVVKDFSDDPDVTRGCRISASVAFAADGDDIRFLQGEGVGRVTLPGLGIPVGEPAINPTPRQMIRNEVRALTSRGLYITLSVEHGRELAKRTFNERVGVVDGISIIGTSGVVQPLSNEAFVQSIGRELEVARAIGCTAIGLASGKRGEELLLERDPSLRVVHYGNFIGDSLQRAAALDFQRVVLGIMIGKAVKLAEGHLDTHSHKVLMNKAFLVEVATSVGVTDAEARLGSLTMARELWDLMPPAFFDAIRERCLQHCRTVFPAGDLQIILSP